MTFPREFAHPPYSIFAFLAGKFIYRQQNTFQSPAGKIWYHLEGSIWIHLNSHKWPNPECWDYYVKSRQTLKNSEGTQSVQLHLSEIHNTIQIVSLGNFYIILYKVIPVICMGKSLVLMCKGAEELKKISLLFHCHAHLLPHTQNPC